MKWTYDPESSIIPTPGPDKVCPSCGTRHNPGDCRRSPTATCPRCKEPLECEPDAEHSRHFGKPRLGYVLYCETCGYEERHIAGREAEIVCGGMVEEI